MDMIFDTHSHTAVSADSEMRAEDAVRAAGAQGIGLVFTEHLDYDFPGDMRFEFDPEAYWRAYEGMRGAALRLGIEVGMQPQTRDRSRAFVERAPFDAVIGSQHLLYGSDVYDVKTFAGHTKDEAYLEYLHQMEKNLRLHGDFIDILGHIDYICRYAPYENPELDDVRYADAIDAVLRAAVETHTVLELNTRRLGDTRAAAALLPIYRRYRELGGRYVTFGSDAHTADAIGAHFDVAARIAAAAGLVSCTFCERKIIPCANAGNKIK
ncbi:MAG: histidinol-phosphatase HisJ family protein [Selenomonadaceae bacterium]|nr:histidinol-phosphatase HisJ family protein [Selenomonadaceae bacterium]